MNENRTLSVALIGTGRIAGGYDRDKYPAEKGVYSHAGAYQRNGKFILETVYDTNTDTALEFKRYWNAKKTAKDLSEICHRYHDVISVCTPDETHFDIISTLIKHRCCGTIFTEKPLATNKQQIREIIGGARKANINVVVNLQRRFDVLYDKLKREMEMQGGRVLTINALYMKGLEHCGVAMIDTIACLCGYPQKVLGYNRVFNQQINEFSYDFVLFYPYYNVSVKAIDSVFHRYCYHLFEIDIFLSDKRVIINDNSRRCEVKEITDYAYDGVKVLNDGVPRVSETGYKLSILNAADYIYEITGNKTVHTINTPQLSYNNKIIIDTVEKSYAAKKEISIEEEEWQS